MRERYQDKCTTLLVAETPVGEETQGKGDQGGCRKGMHASTIALLCVACQMMQTCTAAVVNEISATGKH